MVSSTLNNTHSSTSKVLLLMGPTAAGKTDLALALFDAQPVELISVDSALVYRGMDIGSAKPDADTLARYPHQLVNIRDPASPYSVGEFLTDVEPLIDNAMACGKLPVLVGGTMLYFKALIDGIADMPPADLSIRHRLEARAETEGWPVLHKELSQVDPDMAAQLHPNHSARIGRALEVYLASGITMTEWRARQHKAAKPTLADKYDFVSVAVGPRERQCLHQRIERRFDIMLNEGFLDEVASLKTRNDLHVDLPSIRSVGYRQAWHHLDGLTNASEFRQQAISATKQLAKRQLTWLRTWPNLTWLYTDDENGVKLSVNDLVITCLDLLKSH